eukprot:s3220_g5.t1
MLVFATALPLKEHFDPTSESIHGLCAEEGGSGEPEELEQDPTAGGSGEAEEPGESSAVPEEYQQPEEGEAGSAEAEVAKPFWVDYDEDQEMQVAAEVSEAEGYQGDDPILVAATTSFSGSNPWVFDDANVFCSKDQHGQVERYRRDELIQADFEWLIEAVEEINVPMPDPPQGTPYDEFPEEMKLDKDRPEQQEEQPTEAEAEQEEEEVPDVPLFEVKIREPQDTRSPEEEEVSEHKESSEHPEEPYEEILIYHSAEDRFGHFIMSHFSREDQVCWKQLVLGLGHVALVDDEPPPTLPQTLDEVSPWPMTLMMEVIASEQFHTIMETWQPAMGMDISYDKMQELCLAATKIKLDTQDIHLHHFEEDAKPELPRPELEKPDMLVTQSSTEGDEDVEDGINHLRHDDGSMISPELSALFKEFVRKSKEADKKRQEEEKDPVLPPQEHVNQHLERKEREAEAKHGSSLKKEEPSAPARSSEGGSKC